MLRHAVGGWLVNERCCRCEWQVVVDSGQSVPASSVLISCRMLDTVSHRDMECATSLASLSDMVDILKASGCLVTYDFISA